MKKIVIISDIHCHQYLFNLVLEDIDKDVSEYIFLGDYITDGPFANEILAMVKARGNYIIAGNREVDIANYDGAKWDKKARYRSKEFTYRELTTENIDFIKKLPIYQVIKVEEKKICLAHGTPYNVKEYVFADSFLLFDKLIKDFDCDVYLFGHQHRPFKTMYKNRLFINPGSINTPLDGRSSSKYGILMIDENISYLQKEIFYDWWQASDYYINSNYFLACPEWANLLIYVLRDGVDYRKLFVKKILTLQSDATIICRRRWQNIFVEFMKEYNLPIIKGGEQSD